MPLVEFMYHASEQGTKSKKPDFIRGSADYYNEADKTYVGWVADNRDFYLPDTVVVLTKETFTQRLVTLHQSNPLKHEDTFTEDGTVIRGNDFTEAEVIAYAESQYDYIVNHCKTEEGSL